MIGLRDLRLPPGATWDTAGPFEVPHVTQYRIADDCLDAPAEHPAVVEVQGSQRHSVTFGELTRASGRLANHLIDRGIEPGDRVTVKLTQSIDMAIVVMAVLRAGGIVVPISNVLARAGLEHRLSDSDPRLLVCVGDEAEQSIAAALDIPVLVTQGTTESIEDITARGPDHVTALTDGAAEDPALLLYTSGTSGKPKGVLQAHRFLLGHHALDLAFDRVRDDDIAYSPVDWTWGGGMMLGLLVPLAHGVTVVASRTPGFDPERTARMMVDERVSIGLFPPTVLRMLRAAGSLGGRSSRLRCIVTGAEAVEPELLEWVESNGVLINNAYGQTEANALVGHAATLGRLDPRSMGRVYPGHHVEVLDEDLRPVPDGQPGQLAVHADDPVCMLEYWRLPDATADKIVGGWLLTGDTVRRAPDSTLHFQGRNDDIIKSGAYRLGPSEIEAAVLTVNGVANCAVVGGPDEIRGEVVTAFIEPSDPSVDEEAVADQVRQAVRETVGAHAYPRVVRFDSHLPRTTTGKIDRASLKARLREDDR